jgi:hypothetical protein
MKPAAFTTSNRLAPAVTITSLKGGLFSCRASQEVQKLQLKYRNRRYTIGQYPTLTLAVACTEARKLLAEFTLGKTSPKVISYKKAVERFSEEKEKARRKSTANAYKGLFNRLPFEDHITAITHEEVARKLRRITTQGAYNHHLVAFFLQLMHQAPLSYRQPYPRTFEVCASEKEAHPFR